MNEYKFLHQIHKEAAFEKHSSYRKTNSSNNERNSRCGSRASGGCGGRATNNGDGSVMQRLGRSLVDGWDKPRRKAQRAVYVPLLIYCHKVWMMTDRTKPGHGQPIRGSRAGVTRLGIPQHMRAIHQNESLLLREIPTPTVRTCAGVTPNHFW